MDTDINECVENRDICLHGRCVNRVGGHHCACTVGYQPSSDGTFCVGQSVAELLLEAVWQQQMSDELLVVEMT